MRFVEIFLIILLAVRKTFQEVEEDDAKVITRLPPSIDDIWERSSEITRLPDLKLPENVARESWTVNPFVTIGPNSRSCYTNFVCRKNEKCVKPGNDLGYRGVCVPDEK